MSDAPILTDRPALLRNRARAAALAEPALFLQQDAARELLERRAMVNRRFRDVVVVTGWPDLWRELQPEARVIDDQEALEVEEQSCDLVLHALCLHWANDPVGQLVQARRALRPDGLFLGTLFGGQTLHELRACLAEAEAAVTGGLSPRVLPMAEIRDLGGLLQRAGFALPVADSQAQRVSYASALHLMRDLRAMGEANALAGRPRHLTRRVVLLETARRYADAFPDDAGRIRATFEVITLTGWAPDDSQPQALRPGSATARLADHLGTQEMPLPDRAGPKRD